MSGWQLGLALFGCLLLGAVLGLTLVWWYARRVFQRKLAQLPADLLRGQQTSTSGGSTATITPPVEP